MEDTLLVPKLQLDAPSRVFAQTFAPVKRRQWPWLVAAAVVIVSALANPLVPVDRQVRLSSTAEQLRQSLSAP
jgi:hypothetical protein